jgi:hypothetical protein
MIRQVVKTHCPQNKDITICLGRIKTGSRKLKKNIRLAEVLRPLGGGSESNDSSSWQNSLP